MDTERFVGYILYAMGIIGGTEGVVKKSIPISVAAMVVVILGSYLLVKKE